ncbi:hypothetical protein H6F78_24700 [Coleofasciculus sp. FACHB-64]|uniref:hypothetical protein n=1 Tax=Cyanophyceae TaxID=3028117 RepID=UPI001683B064|nr:MULTISPECIES: hypothetical protein [unclassified Coleofasciculus]MBD1839598.1 hypothetical protein [Coleofasciculus sp. FACHB-501]MBD2048758.1 hypothetical protein [Coleofasciculus sp. FACHB-64]
MEIFAGWGNTRKLNAEILFQHLLQKLIGFVLSTAVMNNLDEIITRDPQDFINAILRIFTSQLI